MIVVSDTSPINYLLLIGSIDLLPQLYQRVIIPQSVYAELQHPSAPLVVQQWLSAMPAWVDVHAAPPLQLMVELGAGEAEAIALAITLRADVLLMDERKGRQEAIAQGLSVAGTLNVLDEAAAKGLISLPAAIQRLLRTNFRVSAELIRELLQREAARSGSSDG
jgi:predicted nucleic acid-binding protein